MRELRPDEPLQEGDLFRRAWWPEGETAEVVNHTLFGKTPESFSVASHSTTFYRPEADEPTVEDAKESILEEARRVVDGPRQQDYGTPGANHARTAAFWSTYLDTPITAKQVCMMNILQKVARSMQRTTRDTLVDIAGYARNVELIEEEGQ